MVHQNGTPIWRLHTIIDCSEHPRGGAPLLRTDWLPMKARKFRYDVAYAQTTVCTPTTCKAMPNVRLFWWESVWPPVSRETETTKESSMKTKTESRKCIRVVLSIKLRLIVMSTNLENRERERRRKKKVGRQASEAQRDKELER